MNALGIHIFAGSFTMGVQQAGFDVSYQIEQHELGWDTARSIGVEVVKMDDVLSHAANDSRGTFGRVDFMYANPRCSCFSGMCTGSKMVGQYGAEGMQTVDIKQVLEVVKLVRPKVLAMESVQRAISVGAPLLDKVAKALIAEGYQVCHLLYDNASVGVPQVRRRYMLIASRVGKIELEIPELKVVKTAGQALAEIKGAGRGNARPLSSSSGDYGPDDYQKVNEEYQAIIPELRPGEGVMRLWQRDPGVFKRLKLPMLQGAVDRFETRGKGRPFGFDTNTMFRIKGEAPSPVVHGGCYNFVHPTKHRPLTVREMAALMCWPKDVFPKGAKPGYQVGKAVAPPVGKWVASAVMKRLQGSEPKAWSRQVDTELHDAVAGRLLNFNVVAPKKGCNIAADTEGDFA